jgi:hypothetical protein
MGEHWVCIKSVPNGCLCAIWTLWFWDPLNVEKGIMLPIEGVEPKPCHSHRACHKCCSCSSAWRVSIFMNSSNPCSSKSLSLWAIASLTCSLMTQLWVEDVRRLFVRMSHMQCGCLLGQWWFFHMWNIGKAESSSINQQDKTPHIQLKFMQN